MLTFLRYKLLTLHHTWNLSYIPRAFLGASMYYTMRHIVLTSLSTIFFAPDLIICKSITIIFIIWNFFHIHYFETLFSISNMAFVILFANLLTSKPKNIRIWNIRIFSAVNHTQSCMAIIFSTSLLICTSCGI